MNQKMIEEQLQEAFGKTASDLARMMAATTLSILMNLMQGGYSKGTYLWTWADCPEPFKTLIEANFADHNLIDTVGLADKGAATDILPLGVPAATFALTDGRSLVVWY